MYPLQQQQCNRYRRVFRQSSAIGGIHGSSQFCATVLPARSDTLPYQSFAGYALPVQRGRNNADTRARFFCQLMSRPGTRRTELCLHIVEHHQRDIRAGVRRWYCRHLTAGIRQDCEQLFNRRYEPVKACIHETVGCGNQAFFDKGRNAPGQLCAVDPVTGCECSPILARRCREELFVLTARRACDFAEWHLPVMEPLP